MDQQDILVLIAAFIAFGFVCYLFGGFNAISWLTKRHRQEAIRRGFAEYNSQTGKWQWKEKGDARQD